MWAAAWPSQSFAVAEHKSTIQADGRFKDKPSGTIPSHRFYHMSQVFLYLPFRNAEHAGQLIGGHPSVGQKIDDALTECAFRRQHVSYRKH